MKRFLRSVCFILASLTLFSFTGCQAIEDEGNGESGLGDFSDTAEITEIAEDDSETKKTEGEAKKSYSVKGYILSASDTKDTFGNGMSMVYKLSDGRLFVFDGGNASVKNFLIEALQKIAGTKKVKVAAWVMTHDHGDHYGALLEYYFANSSTIGDVLEIEEFWMNPMNSEGYNYQNHLKNAFPNAKMRRLAYGEKITLDEIKINVLCTPEVIPNDSRNDVNTNSLVMMLNIDGRKILMTGDANEPAWDFMVKNQSKGEDYSLKCQYLQLPHHGVQDAGTAEGYDAAAPRYLVIPSTIDLANKLTTAENAKPSYELYKEHGIDIGSLKSETNNTTYWFAGCYNKTGTKDIKCFFTYNFKK